MLENVSQLVEMQLPALGPNDRLLLVHPPSDEGVSLLARRYPGQVSVFSWDAGIHARSDALGDGKLLTGIQGDELQPVVGGEGVSHVVLYMTKAKERLELTLALLAETLSIARYVALVGEKRSGVESAARRLHKEKGWAVRKDASARHSQWWQVVPSRDTGRFNLDRFSSVYSVGLMGEGVESCTKLHVSTLPGVFSHGALDAGTEFLLAALQDVVTQRVPQTLTVFRRSGPAAKVLDFGCGSGVISLWLAHHFPQLRIDALDIDALALLATRRNCSANSINAAQIQTRLSDGLSALTGRYALIVTNPPFHQGQKQDLNVTRQFLRECQQHLTPTGELVLVANRFLPYAECLEGSFRRWSILSENGRFRVYHAQM